MPFWSIAAPILGGLLSGGAGASGARSQARAIERASEPKPFWSNQTQTPWGPAAGPLEAAILEAGDIHRRNVGIRPPPQISTSGIRGASANLREIVDAMRQRALTSRFIPDAQSRALELMTGTNPMVDAAFSRASSHTNPLLEMLQARAMESDGGPGAFNAAASPMGAFLQNLMAGQRQLGAPAKAEIF